ncbi:haloacid dehalogenase type II, partial [Streptomyces parvus]
MAELTIDAVVFDVLGTLVDEPAGLRAGIRVLTPSASPPPSTSSRPSSTR